MVDGSQALRWKFVQPVLRDVSLYHIPKKITLLFICRIITKDSVRKYEVQFLTQGKVTAMTLDVI
jgi:hypothetical protein